MIAQRYRRPIGSRARGLRIACSLALLTLVWTQATPRDSSEPTASVQRKKELQDEQRELKDRLAKLRKSVTQTESARSEAADALAASETAISNANRQLQQLATNRRQVEQRIAELQLKQEELRHAQATHSSRLAATLQAQEALAESATERSWRDPVGASRDTDDETYLDPVVTERARRIGEIDDRRTQLKALEDESHARSLELAHLDDAERRGRAQLLKQQETRKQTLEKLGAQLDQQRRSVAALERDEARLGDLIGRIGRLLAEQAQRAKSRASEGKGAGGAGKGVLPPPLDASHAVAMNATQFAKLKGRLKLPVQGVLTSRFGSARTTDDGQTLNGAPAWKGVIIKAAPGTPVHALAAGQIVYADWLRGFGNLLILDHGEGFLSVYAFNETLLRSVGDHVASDDIIATVGNSGGTAHSSLYFEMRYQGQAFDPLGWAVAR